MALTQIDHVSENEEMQECIDNCFEAAQACEWCADECVGEGEEMANCLRLCRDVADLTTMHARFMARNSNYSAELAEACAGACEECAEECERHDDDHCQVCADVLRDCAETCRNMATA
ncbi:four-helix bundle copper-binding protein [Haloterrigena salifodinae]|uniref:Four-helix bundle copper-binding protein n=1 Tax=Haloterrigena salifodinae TaxID=2675099 RepID=A0A8T8DZL4_9EURY|nr:four-helix bundle copper-binding protein [Haloterrigena salifodinae]QRV14939.1 four-helix bundle copper-binding protein [Haloterrigena salifodinae]